MNVVRFLGSRQTVFPKGLLLNWVKVSLVQIWGQLYLMFPNCHSVNGNLSWTYYKDLRLQPINFFIALHYRCRFMELIHRLYVLDPLEVSISISLSRIRDSLWIFQKYYYLCSLKPLQKRSKRTCNNTKNICHSIKWCIIYFGRSCRRYIGICVIN